MGSECQITLPATELNCVLPNLAWIRSGDCNIDQSPDSRTAHPNPMGVLVIQSSSDALHQTLLTHEAA